MHPILGKKIMVIIAHPDDEGYLFSGTIRHNFRAGGKTVLVCATLGEKGISHLPRPITAAQMKNIRFKELRAAAEFIGSPTVHVLHLPDGRVCDHEKTFLARTRRVVAKTRPNVLMSFGPDGISGHRDHITCWRVAKRLSKEFRLPLFVSTVPPQYRKRAARWITARRFNPHYHRMAPYRLATIKVPHSYRFKLAVLRHYPSQVDPRRPFPHFPDKAARVCASAEYFAREQ